LFIIDEHDDILNMKRARHALDLEAYRAAVQRWMSKADLRLHGKGLKSLQTYLPMPNCETEEHSKLLRRRRCIEPFLIPVVSDLVRSLREVGVDFCVVGAQSRATLFEITFDSCPGQEGVHRCIGLGVVDGSVLGHSLNQVCFVHELLLSTGYQG
jgi:hypothetical protein